MRLTNLREGGGGGGRIDVLGLYYSMGTRADYVCGQSKLDVPSQLIEITRENLPTLVACAPLVCLPADHAEQVHEADQVKPPHISV